MRQTLNKQFGHVQQQLQVSDGKSLIILINALKYFKFNACIIIQTNLIFNARSTNVLFMNLGEIE